jgi:hypothetical protein
MKIIFKLSLYRISVVIARDPAPVYRPHYLTAPASAGFTDPHYITARVSEKFYARLPTPPPNPLPLERGGGKKAPLLHKERGLG